MRSCTSTAASKAAGRPAPRFGLRRPAARGSLRCAASWPRCGTRFVRCAHCAQTPATSQLTKRAARAGHEACAPRRRTLTPALAGPRPCRCGGDTRTGPTAARKAGAGLPPGAPVWRRGAQGLGPRAQRASWTDSLPLFDHSERSERREFGNGPQARAPQRSRRMSATASPKRPAAAQPRPCARGLARASSRMPQVARNSMEQST